MNILLLGSGGREHAFAKKISESTLCHQLFIAPGNAGTEKLGINVPIKADDFLKIKSFCLENQIKMVIVGPEDPLVKGIYDFFKNDDQLNDIPVIGPAKKFMQKYNIPTADYQSFTKENINEGFAFLEKMKPPYVLKADGLAAGKGVLIINDLEEAKNELENMLVKAKFAEASSKVVIEEFLTGIELSCFVITDGKNYKILPTAKDYKRIGEGDTGLNTGGMGAVSPVPFANAEFMQKIEERIVKPTIQGLINEQIEYKGFIFIGLIKVGDEPYVIEYNVRMGDPETEVVIPRIKSDLVEIFSAVASQNLDNINLEINPQSATTIVLVSGGYPEDYEKGKIISGIENIEDSLVFHAGTTLDNDKIVSNGGRVLAITSLAETYQEALKISYKNIDKISFDKMYYRKDIGFDL